MKRTTFIIIFCCIAVSSLAGCGQVDEVSLSGNATITTATTTSDETSITTVTTSMTETENTNISTTSEKASLTDVKKTSETAHTTTETNEVNNNGNDNTTQQNVQSNDMQEQNNQSVQTKAQQSTAEIVTQKPKTTTTQKKVVTTTTSKKPVTTTAKVTTTSTIIKDETSLANFVKDVDTNYYNIQGKNLLTDGSDYSKAEAVFNWARDNCSGNCIEFSIDTYYLCKGAGLECNYAFMTENGWYGHVCNIVKVESIWYIFDTQGNRFLKSDKYDEVVKIFDGNENTLSILISPTAY